MSELIDRQAFIEQERRLYCEDCDRRKGKKNGKLTVCYEIGEAPCRACWLDDALTDLEDFPTASPWHRVEDWLPDDSRDVIIFTASRIVGVGSFIRPNWYQWYSGGGLPVDVTHWMPLPEPPKEDA